MTNLIDSYRLSSRSDFKTFSYPTEMSKLEEYAKSPIALVLGVLPFVVSMVAMSVLKVSASLTDWLDNAQVNNGVIKILKGGARTITALYGVGAAALMLLSAKIFSLSQRLVWWGYVEKPSGDGPNTRLAQYGSGTQPWKDIVNISTAFFSADSLSKNEWKLKEWSQVQI